jgi:glycosyltransferase involved in cell wall biosynthesis
MNQAAGITVVFATHNGADTLPRMLDALEDLETPMGGVKIVAVDNASTDNSAALIKARSASLPVELLTETRRGKSAALNRALSAI